MDGKEFSVDEVLRVIYTVKPFGAPPSTNVSWTLQCVRCTAFVRLSHLFLKKCYNIINFPMSRVFLALELA